MEPRTTFQSGLDRVVIGAVVVALCVGWTLFAGKDIGWDLFNHHMYLPFSLLSGRFDTDLYAAGPQSYQNPIGYVPFYLLARSELPAWTVGVSLALMQALPTAWAMLRIAQLVLGGQAASRNWVIAGLALSFSAPIFLYTLGTSANDPLCTALLLVSLAIALDPVARGGLAATAGLALGLALAIKPTSIVLGLPILVLVVSRLLARQWRWPTGASFALALLGTFGVAGGLWGYWLSQRYGSPTFPLFNNLFQSPLAPTGPTTAARFLPDPGWGWVVRLWEMALLKPFVMVEVMMPDFRPLLATVAALFAGALAAFRYGGSIWLRWATWLRPDVQLVLAVGIAYVLWLMSSGNARYAIGYFLLVGLILVRAVQVSWASRWALPSLFGLAALQFALLVEGGEIRLLSTPWDSRSYVPIEVPRKLIDEPALHLSLGMQSYSIVAPFLHPGGALINLKGQVSLPNSGPLGDRLRQQLARWEGRTRFLFATPSDRESEKFARMVKAESESLAHGFGLRIQFEACEVIRLMPAAPGAFVGPDLLSCPALAFRHVDPLLERNLAVAGQVFAAIESACPRIFGPTPMTSDHRADLIWRHYTNSDSRVNISQTEGVILAHYRAMNPVKMGTIEQVLATGGSSACKAWEQLKRL